MRYANPEQSVVTWVAGDAQHSVLATALTPEELAGVAPYQPTPAEINAPILAQLQAIDAKSIRALREGNTDRISALEAQAVALRAQLV